MAQQIIITKDNYGIELECWFVDAKKKALDITGYSVEVAIMNPSGEQVELDQAVVKSANIGLCSYVLQSKHTADEGLYTSIWTVTDENGYVTAQENVYYFVKERLQSSDSSDNTVDADGLEDKIKELEDEINNTKLVLDQIKKVDSSAEIVGARGNFPLLENRLDSIDININNINRFSELHYINSIADEMSCLIKCANGETILIDCGETFSKTQLRNRLKTLNVKTIDHFIVTHFHSDHVGGYDIVFDNFNVKKVYYKPITWTLSNKEINWKTKELYDGFKLKLNSNNIEYVELTNDITINISEKESIKLLNTQPYQYENKANETEYNVYDYNYESLMCLYQYANAKVLLQGDCPSQVAYEKYGHAISHVDHLQISHHGGKDVIKDEWINLIRAKTGYYSYVNSTNILRYKVSTLTKIYKYDPISSISGCLLINESSVYTTVSLIENTLADRLVELSGKKYYISQDGNLVIKGVITTQGKMYLIDDWCVQFPSGDGWCYVGETCYAMNNDGSIKTNQWVSSSGNNYYVDNQGIYYKNCTVKIGTTDVTFDAEGRANI